MIDYNHKLHDEFIQNILDTRGRFNVDGYKERHHIMPECCGGETVNENLIDLTAQEHYEAHKLLAKENPDNWGLQTAWWTFCIRKASPNAPEIFITADEYAAAKIAHSKMMSNRMSGENNPRYGNHNNYNTPESLEKRSITIKNKSDEEKINSYKKWLAAIQNKSEEEVIEISKKKSQSMKDWWQNPDNIEKITERNNKISERMTGEGNPMYGKTFSNEQRLKRSEKQKGHPNYNIYPDSPETRARKSAATIGANNPRAVKVKCVETGEEFGCKKEAYLAYNCTKLALNKALNDPIKIAGGYHWEYVDKK